MPQVLNRRTFGKEQPANAVYVGRPSKWGNPFSHLSGTQAKYKVESRSEAVEQYRRWLMYSNEAEELRQSIYELSGKDLVCWCAPQECHADVLLELANEGFPNED